MADPVSAFPFTTEFQVIGQSARITATGSMVVRLGITLSVLILKKTRNSCLSRFVVVDLPRASATTTCGYRR